MNIYDPEGTWRAETELRYARFRELERRGLTTRLPEPGDSIDEERGLRWWRYFSFEAPLHRELERPAYV